MNVSHREALRRFVLAHRAAGREPEAIAADLERIERNYAATIADYETAVATFTTAPRPPVDAPWRIDREAALQGLRAEIHHFRALREDVQSVLRGLRA